MRLTVRTFPRNRTVVKHRVGFMAADLSFGSSFITANTLSLGPLFPAGAFISIDVGFAPIAAAFPLFATGLAVAGLLGWREKRKAAAALATS